MTSPGDWLLLQELLERGDPAFVDRLRSVTDADALGDFAGRWYENRNANAHRLLLAYLERPLNAYRHEALVKRLFKRAETAGDDAVMARFLVAFDRSIRRVVRNRVHHESRSVDSREEAERQVSLWRSLGYQQAAYFEHPMGSGKCHVWGLWTEPTIGVAIGTTMPRGGMVTYDHVDPSRMRYEKVTAPDWIRRLKLDPHRYAEATEPPESIRKQLERFRLFTPRTRRYLRRRAWRYFRRLGRTHPERYVAAISEAMVLYEDADVATGLALLDNWGLVHALFHESPVLVSRPKGWDVAEDGSLSDLEPSPIFEDLWRSAPRAILDLIVRARCRPVRQWAVRMLKRDPAARSAVTIDDLLNLLGHADEEVVAFASDWLGAVEDLSTVAPERWLAVAESASPGALETLTAIMRRQISPDRISIEAAARLASARPLPIARLGLDWLKTKTPSSDDDRRSLLPLLEAECEPIRPEILAWLRSVLSDDFRSDELLEFLDSRHADARAEGLAWFRAEPKAREDVDLWHRLMESPYDDVRLALTSELEARLRRDRTDAHDLALDSDRLRLLWASVLLNVNRGSRSKPGAIDQVAHRLARRPEEAESLLPMLAIGLRSLRAPERRAAMAAIVRLVATRPDSEAMVRAALPEWQWA